MSMRAAVHQRYGTPDVLHETTIEHPSPAAGELLIRVAAASVNGYDVLVRSGALKMVSSRRFPKRTGLDFAGEIVEPATPGSGFSAGDKVWGVLPLHRLGSVADYVAVAPRHVSRRPARLTDVEAAALPVVGATALIALRDIARLQAGERLLVRGASGGVGAVAVQLGKAFDAHVTGLASAPNLAAVRDLGADLALDYGQVGPADLEPFDVILDTVGHGIAAWRRRLAPGGRMAAIVPDPAHPLRSMAYFGVSRVFGTRRVRFFSAKPDTATLDDLARHVASGAVRPVIDGVYPLERIADAHRAFEAGGRFGKQIVRLDEDARP